MSEVGPADRSRLLRSKKTELSEIVTSRKRKLREFFAVCDNEGPIPQIKYPHADAPATSVAENRFLEVTDILKDRLFDESNLPTRRQLRSETSKQRSPIRKPSPESRGSDASRKKKAQRDGSTSRRNRAPTPPLRVDERATAPLENGVREKTTPMIILEGSNSKGSQAHLPNGPPPIAGEAGNEPTGHTVESQSQLTGGAPPENVLESERIRKVVESRPNSPGVDPRKASPVSTEDTANLFNTPIDGPGSADTDHKAKTIHLPPKEVQEERIRLQKAEETQNPGRYRRETKHGRLGLQLPPHDTQHEPMSSPGSTNGAQSATTPALHDTSTDTSPDNEGSRYDVEGGERDQDDGTRTPVKLPPARDFVDKDDNDSILKAQIQSTQTEVPGSSPSAANDQLRMEEQAASLSTVIQDGNDMGTTDQQAATTMEDDGQTVNYLSKEATEVVQEAVQIQDSLTNEATKVVQEVVQDVVPEPTSNARDVEVSGGQPCAELSVTMATEVPDSDNDGRTLVDAMEVDATTIKDSFDSDTANNQIKNPSAVPGGVDSDSENLANQKRSSITSTSATVCRTSSTASAAPPVLERMTTRISSNTIRHKSVAEIIGEIPRPTSADRSSKINVNTGSSGTPSSPSRSSTPQSPGTRMRSLVEKAKERERSKLSTVTFQKRTNKSSSNDTALMPTGSQRAKPQEDYLKPLFIASATNDKRGIPALDSLLATAHKTITTANAYVPIHESQTNKILKRIYQLQNMNKWSLRQPKRAVEPNRPTTHWDVLLQEAKWMRTDFREERKWKSAAARNLAFACAEWVESNLEDRKLLQVKTVPPRFLSSEKDTEMSGMSSQEVPHSTPELVASEGIDSPMDDLDEEPRLDLMETVAPTAIFTLQDDDVVFGLRDSPTARKLLAELPMYGAPLRVPQSDILTSEIDPDRLWRRPALPLSKYVEGRMELKFDGPPRKKSRYEYDDEDEDDDEVVFGEQGQKKPVLPPETTDVALFDPQHKHIRDRIHSSHQFRPPSEFPMPLQSFFETRTPSQWTWDEDNELKALVRECTYNWSLISSMLTSKSLFAAGNERRTPWECFERWVQMEGLPNDMQKTHYFRAYMSRIEAANRNVVAQAAAAQAASMANGQAQPPPRRRATTSIRVDQRRKQKHLTLVDAMRKLAKKRETSIQKQQQAAGMAAMRKANENQQPAQPRNLHTPQEFSRLKHDRDEQFKERLLQLQQRQEAQRRQAAMLQQRNAQGQTPGVPPIAGGPRPPPPNGIQPPNGAPGSSGQTLQVPGQNRNPRPIPPQMSQQMGQQMGPQMQNNLRVPQGMNGVPPAPMQAMQGQLPMPNPAVSVGLINQAAQTAEQQRAMIQMQQQSKPNAQSPQPHNSPPRTSNGMQQPNAFQMQNMMAFNTNDHRSQAGTPPINGMVAPPGQGQHGPAGSPRPGQHPPVYNMEPYAARIDAQVRQQFPNATPEQILSLVTEQLKKTMQNQRSQPSNKLAQSAMNAAAGGSPASVPGMNGQVRGLSSGMNEKSPQLYAQMLRQQQENQHKADQARVAAAGLAAAQGQTAPAGNNGQQAQGHAHRNSAGSANSVK